MLCQVVVPHAFTPSTLFILQVKHLDGHVVNVSLTPPVQPDSEVVIKGEGMPISKEPGKKGDLHVKLRVQMPRLNDQQKEQIKRILGDS